MGATSYASPMTPSILDLEQLIIKLVLTIFTARASHAVGGSATELPATDAWGGTKVNDITECMLLCGEIL